MTPTEVTESNKKLVSQLEIETVKLKLKLINN
jgi:hypothetical protein